LAALSFPVISKMKDSAAKTVSISNLRQLTTAVISYANDNDGNYPPSTVNYLTCGYVNGTELLGWAAVVQYLGQSKPASDDDLKKMNLDVFYCKHSPSSTLRLNPSANVRVGTDYTLWTNARNVQSGALDDQIPKRLLGSALASATQWPIITDNAGYSGVLFRNPKDGSAWGMHAAFADGSVRWYLGNAYGSKSEIVYYSVGYAGMAYAVPK
jgi:hypothetical protein